MTEGWEEILFYLLIAVLFVMTQFFIRGPL